MNNKNKKEPWRVIVFIISMLFIAFMWVKNDVTQTSHINFSYAP